MQVPHPSEGLRTDGALVVADIVLVVVSYVIALTLRYDGDVPPSSWKRLLVALPLVVACYLALHVRLRLYGRVWTEAGAPEARHIVVASVIATALLTTLNALTPGQMLPMSVPVNAGALILLVVGGIRFRSRLQTRTGTQPATGTRILLVGPLHAARAVVDQMNADPEQGLLPAAVLTDDRTAWGRTLSGVPVVGPIPRLEEVARAHRTEQVVLLPGALDREQVRQVADLAQTAGMRSRALPTLLETVNRVPGLDDIRDLSLEDLLGRDQVDVDSPRVRAIITGHRVLITGAGGSIGSEIAAQVSRLQPAELILLDHDETHLHDALSGLDPSARGVLGDIRDAWFLEELFRTFRPEVVFHAAAHKHVPILEGHPSEAVRTNVVGTDLLVQAAQRAGTARFVAISTDKAVRPACVMGASKRLAEELVVGRSGPGMRYCAVRFGNVLGSRGSVVPTFLRQLAAGGPLTVTHPDVTRFFMTTKEAVSLVMQAAATARGGEVFLLDMGEPVRVVDLAERMIALAGYVPGRDIGIEFIGLRPGEKLAEELSGARETLHPTSHPKVSRVDAEHCDPDLLRVGVTELARRAMRRNEESTRRLLFELADMPYVVHLDGEMTAAKAAARLSTGAPLSAAIP